MALCMRIHRCANELLLLSDHMCTLLYNYTIMQSILNNVMALKRNANCLTVMAAIIVLRHSALKVINIICFMLCQQRYACICKSKQFMLLQIWIRAKALCIRKFHAYTNLLLHALYIYKVSTHRLLH